MTDGSFRFLRVRFPKMKKLNLLYTGKAKKVYATENSDYCIFEYKDAATAFNGQKVGFFDGKGMINNKMANAIFKLLEKDGIKTHFVEELSDRESLVKRVEIITLEVILRNISAGSFCKRYGVEEGEVFDKPTIEFSYKNDALGDPLINSYHAYALKIATEEDVLEIKRMAFAVNESLKKIFLKMDIKLVDFKLEFGKTKDGEIVLADEISPDTCRLWDAETNKKLDKDRFRFDMGEFSDVYFEVWNRLKECYGEII